MIVRAVALYHVSSFQTSVALTFRLVTQYRVIVGVLSGIREMSQRAPSLKTQVRQVPALEDRPLITSEQARQLMGLFKVFGNDSRLRLLHALVREGELCVTDLAAAVEMKPQAVSNQLQRLVDRGILGARRNGSNIFYRVVDPCVPVLLDRGMCLIECHPE